MQVNRKPPDCVAVIFGASGDLAARKLGPALLNLYLDGKMPERFSIIGVARTHMSEDAFRQHLKEGIDAYSRRKPDEKAWREFAQRVHYLAGDYDDPQTYSRLAEFIAGARESFPNESDCFFYLSTPPSVVATVAEHLSGANLTQDRRHIRIVVEKPFGHDRASARELNAQLTRVFDESQIYRIDHFLGKETVQNILALRFANSILEPVWNRRYIDHVQITVAEQVGLENRGGYYDRSGALRDMIQNHLMQVLCFVAMECPVNFDANEIRNKKADVLRAIRPIPVDQVHHHAVRGQYGPGWLRAKRLPAYRDEQGVRPDSPTETFAALKLIVDNWRWSGVPFYMRTGKRMPARVSEVVVEFNDVPHQAFPASATGDIQPNRLIIRIQPDEGVSLKINAKQPGTAMRLRPVEMQFKYRDSFKGSQPEAYETLLLDVMLADATSFMRADQVDAAWCVVTPILEAWELLGPSEFPNYPANSWGPEAATALLARDNRNWFNPEVAEDVEHHLALPS